jgi:hypothetical protein
VALRPHAGDEATHGVRERVTETVEAIRESPPPRPDPFLEPRARQLPAPARYPRPTMGCLPVLIGIFAIGSGGVWWPVTQFVQAGDPDLVAGSHRACQEPHYP